MAKLNLKSNITFLYFQNLEAAKPFFTQTLGLALAGDFGWACVYELGGKSFLGAVDAANGSIEIGARGGVLVSLTVDDAEAVHESLKGSNYLMTGVKRVKELALRSFFITGPEGYQFEIQEFDAGEMARLFN